MISTSEIRISVVTRADTVNEAVRVVHTAFGLDGETEAVVYARYQVVDRGVAGVRRSLTVIERSRDRSMGESIA